MGSDIPKQYLEVAGATLLEHSLRALLGCQQIAAVVVALQAQDQRAAALPLMTDPRVQTVQGAQERSGSVLAGLRELERQAQPRDWVLVHDAARPCLRLAEIERLITAVTATGTGGLLAEPVVDTLKQAGANGLVERTLDRSSLWRAQTPQMFRIGELRGALEAAHRSGTSVTDEAAAMEAAGFPVQLVAGSAENLKVTVPADLPLIARFLAVPERV